MISTSNALLAIIAMSVITYLLRAFPTFVPRKWLESPRLKAFNYLLPLSVMMVLILASLNIDMKAPDIPLLIAKGFGLITVLISYIFRKNILISIIVGISTVNGVLFLLA